LKGDVCRPDYDFLDTRLDAFYREICHFIDVTGWTHGHLALSPRLNYAWNEVAIMQHLFPHVPGIDAYKEILRGITRDSNEALFRVVEDTARMFCEGAPRLQSVQELQSQCEGFLRRLTTNRDAFILRNQNLLIEALERDGQPLAAATAY
jgi:hypothetical protein